VQLPILYQDDDVVVVHKASGLLVHRTALDRHATEFALQSVRDQLGRSVYPVHRLDRATSGALVFALSAEAARALTEEFTQGRVEKVYLAVVRGTPPSEVCIDYPLKEELDPKADRLARIDKPAQPARTKVTRLAEYEFAYAVDKFPTARYSLVRAEPRTGRKHQIRRHLRHIGHPIIGDVTYGIGKHNRFFAETLQVRRLLLASVEVTFRHPRTGVRTQVRAALAPDFQKLMERLGWESHLG
jgi:tRNA pseudouridine65 synthase